MLHCILQLVRSCRPSAEHDGSLEAVSAFLDSMAHTALPPPKHAAEPDQAEPESSARGCAHEQLAHTSMADVARADRAAVAAGERFREETARHARGLHAGE